MTILVHCAMPIMVRSLQYEAPKSK